MTTKTHNTTDNLAHCNGRDLTDTPDRIAAEFFDATCGNCKGRWATGSRYGYISRW